jgi:hypothetical protein
MLEIMSSAVAVGDSVGHCLILATALMSVDMGAAVAMGAAPAR